MENVVTLYFQSPFASPEKPPANGENLEEIIFSSGYLSAASPSKLSAYYTILIDFITQQWQGSFFSKAVASSEGWYIITFSPTLPQNIAALHDAINIAVTRVPKEWRLNPHHDGNIDSPVGKTALGDGSTLQSCSPGITAPELESIAHIIESLPSPGSAGR